MTCVLVRYHEVALKKGNRPYFVELLKRNLVSAVKGLGLEEAKSLPARLLLRFSAGGNAEEIRRRVEGVFGVANFSFAERVPRDLDAIQAKVLDALAGKQFASFRVDARRADKDSPLASPEINRRIGAAIKEGSGARVALKNGELTIAIEILPRSEEHTSELQQQF